MSIFQKIFGAAPTAAPQPNPSNALVGNKPTQGTETSTATAPNGTVPAGSGTETTPPASPLDKYKDMWQPDTNAESNPPSQSVDPAKLLEAASKVDFTKVLDREVLAKISGGGEDAVAALLQVLNKSSQTVYGQSMVTTAKIVEQAISQAREEFASQIPDAIRRQGAHNKVFEENPAFANPAVAPLIEAQVAQLAQKFPKATPTELHAMAKEYLSGVASLINPPKADVSRSSKTSKDEDWSAYLGS